jgi:hypothetical protein
VDSLAATVRRTELRSGLNAKQADQWDATIVHQIGDQIELPRRLKQLEGKDAGNNSDRI